MFLKRAPIIPGFAARIAFSLLAVVFVAACSGSSSDSDDQTAGRVSFSVQWERQASRTSHAGRTAVSDCSDVDMVSAAVYDTSGSLLQTGGPWNCDDHEGTVTQVPANRYVSIAIVGLTSDLARYRGASSDTFYLPSGGSVDAGTITASAFGVTLTSPSDGASVAPFALVLTWNAVSGADHYIVQIADDSSFTADSILQTITADASANPSCRPETAGMNGSTAYYWRVQAVDSAGNTSEHSTSRQFNVNFNLLTVTITAPVANSVEQSGDAINFNATVLDPQGNPLSEGDLTSIEWNSSVDGLLSNELSFSLVDINNGEHTITLSVESGLNYGDASITFRINEQPVATILSPTSTDSHPSNTDLNCNGTATDPEDGSLSGGDLVWELYNPSGDLIDSDTGISPVFESSNFVDVGNYTLTLEATDSDQGSTTTTVTFFSGII
jgi:hypothetical protein